MTKNCERDGYCKNKSAIAIDSQKFAAVTKSFNFSNVRDSLERVFVDISLVDLSRIIGDTKIIPVQSLYSEQAR